MFKMKLEEDLPVVKLSFNVVANQNTYTTNLLKNNG